MRQAVEVADRAIACVTVPYETWEWAALTHPADGDEDGYRRTRAAIRLIFGEPLPESIFAP